jgi:hypothetical protein
MKHFVFSIALSALVIVAVSATTQAAYYHHRHHHYRHQAILPPPTGTTTALVGRAEVMTSGQLVEPFGCGLALPILLRLARTAAL